MWYIYFSDGECQSRQMSYRCSGLESGGAATLTGCTDVLTVAAFKCVEQKELRGL